MMIFLIVLFAAKTKSLWLCFCLHDNQGDCGCDPDDDHEQFKLLLLCYNIRRIRNNWELYARYCICISSCSLAPLTEIWTLRDHEEGLEVGPSGFTPGGAALRLMGVH